MESGAKSDKRGPKSRFLFIWARRARYGQKIHDGLFLAGDHPWEEGRGMTVYPTGVSNTLQLLSFCMDGLHLKDGAFKIGINIF